MRGWQLGRAFGAFINNHNVGGSTVPADALAAGLAPFNDVTLVHCVRWQDNNIAQLSHSHLGYPAPATSAAWKIWSDNGGHVSIAGILEMQMRHGMPPFQMALNYGILPSLSPDVDTNMTPDPFSMMRGAFTTAARPGQRSGVWHAAECEERPGATCRFRSSSPASRSAR